MANDKYLFVVSGAAGTGKDSVVKALREAHPEIEKTVSATTLADRGHYSYLKRLRRRMARMPQAPDCFLCQLSTNDATFRSVPGRVSRSFRADDFDASTTVGGMEAILAMVREKWDCPIVFYTAARYDNPRYHKLVNLLVDLSYGFIDPRLRTR